MQPLIDIGRYVLPLIALLILYGSLSSLLRSHARTYTMATLKSVITGDVFPVTQWETSIGRSRACDIVLSYPAVSRAHAVLSRRGDSFFISDTDSKLGVFVGSKRVVRTAPVKNGDTIYFGGIGLVFFEGIKPELEYRVRRARAKTVLIEEEDANE